ncbi:MAG: NAD-dependent epimerase/dehydratase family protein [Pikeienuella sp.]
MTKRLYITGCRGFLGSVFLNHFAAHPDVKVTGVARGGDDAGGLIAPVGVITGDWLEPGDEDATVLHCAGLSNPRLAFGSLARATRDYITPHIRMVRRLRARGWRGRLLFMSSGGAVYGDPETLPISESHPTRPKGFYGLQKLYLENAFAAQAETGAFEFASLRVSNPYGSRKMKAGQGVVPILLNALQQGTPFKVIGETSAKRDYIHLRDLCAAVEAAMAAPLPGGCVKLNIGSGRGISLEDLIAMSEAATGKTLLREQVPSNLDVKSNILDCTMAERVLGWRATTAFEDGLQDLLEAPRADHY